MSHEKGRHWGINGDRLEFWDDNTLEASISAEWLYEKYWPLSIGMAGKIQELEKERKKAYPVAVFSEGPKFDYTKVLIEATERRDKIKEQIVILENSVEKMPEEMREFMLASTKPAFEGQLEEVEKQISNLQKMMEEGG